MNVGNSSSVADFARRVADACVRCSAFDATQTIEAGSMRVVARVRFRRPDRWTVEHATYTHPFLELEERLTGDVEYTAQELTGLSLHCDGQRTWVYDASTGVCVIKPGRELFEPVPQMALLGEIDCLRDIPHDYLLRDLGTGSLDGREMRLLGLKPKRVQRVEGFKVLTFLARSVSVAIDPETLFPVRLEVAPAAHAAAHPMVGPDGRISVHSTDVRLDPPPLPAFDPPEGTRLFREETVPVDDLASRTPFAVPLLPFRDAGFEAFDATAVLTEDVARGRAYASVPFFRPAEAQRQAASLTLRVGNYLSRNMARRRITLSESGEALALGDRQARFLDRRAAWEDQSAADLDPAPAPRELSWEHDGVFWFLTAVHVERPALVDLASRLAAEGSDPG